MKDASQFVARPGWMRPLRYATVLWVTLVIGIAPAAASDLDAERAALDELADMLANQPDYWAEVPPIGELAGTWGLSARDCENAEEVDYRILHLNAETLRVDDLSCTFGEMARHDSGLALIVEAECTSDEGREAAVFALTRLADGQISIFQDMTGTNYLRCE